MTVHPFDDFHFFAKAEMPLTPKGYCDSMPAASILSQYSLEAEMPLTPKGYCDSSHQAAILQGAMFFACYKADAS